jgi:dipeptidyl aminopeptidase/acylaminoacyl peptidase
MRTPVLLALLASAALPTSVHASTVDRPDCSAILPRVHTPAGRRPLTPEDLVRLRDIGPVEPQTFATPFFTISPDGRWAALQLRQADPQRNAHCLAMVIVNLSRKVPPRLVDQGGDAILFTFDFRGMADFPSGLMKVITPRWSGDGRWVAFLKRSGGRTQVWRAFADGSGSAPLTNSQEDVVDFRIGSDGRSIVYATRPGLRQQQREYEQEGLNGWRYDDRFAPWISKRPMPRAPVERRIQVLDDGDGQARAATAAEAAMVDVDREIIAVAGAAPALESEGLEIGATGLSGGAVSGGFRARLDGGATATCADPACEGAMSPWWMPGKRHVRFFRRDGWARGSTAIYDWDLGSGEVRRLYMTEDLLSSCTPDARSLICLVDSSLLPRRLVRLDPVTGERETLFDPNPEFSRLALGKAERLHWRNGFGIETIADLVLPVGYRPGKKYPMVIVQYDTRGFLRGGTGDEYPIQAFANRGYTVLSFGRPRPPVDERGVKEFEEAGRLSLREFSDRRSVQSSLEAGIRLVVDRGIADPKRIGITGLSDGSSTVEWALNHSRLFSAAAMSSCCWDPAFVSRVGPTAARHFLSEGYPGILGRNDPFWKDMALEANAHRISTPILVHASEQEFLGAVETYTALREAGVPIDMFVYPDEYHSRWQPAHRLATYRRSLDWFDYWLRGIRSDAPDRQSELKEWDRLRSRAGHAPPT